MNFLTDLKTICLAGLLMIPAASVQADGNPGQGHIAERQRMPVYRQPDGISCGPTCCAMVLQYYGIQRGIGPLKTAAGTRKFGDQLGYTHPSGMKDAFFRSGLPVHLYRGSSVDDIARYIRENRPPTLLLRSGRDSWHWVVAVAYKGGGRKTFLLHDPGSGSQIEMTADQLFGAWTFSHDMQGNYIADPRCGACGGDGNLVRTRCVTCSGTGNISAKMIGFKTKCPTCSGQGEYSSKCHLCGGDGRTTDLPRKAVEMSGAVGHTMVVPVVPPPHANRPPGQGPGHQGQGNGPVPPQPQGGNAIAIGNQTSLPITYDLAIDGGAPQRITVQPGQINTYSSRTGRIEIQYDSDMTDGMQMRRYRLTPGSRNTYRINGTAVFLYRD